MTNLFLLQNQEFTPQTTYTRQGFDKLANSGCGFAKVEGRINVVVVVRSFPAITDFECAAWPACLRKCSTGCTASSPV
jgi:hypothetical protein